MRIVIDSATGVRMEDPSDFKHLSVTLTGEAAEAQNRLKALRNIGRTEESTHVYLSPTRLTTLAGTAAESPQWRDGLTAMISYAANHGWTDADGLVRAHVELAHPSQ